MDTDDLSREAYEAVISEAEKLTRDLTVHFGVLASSCKDEPTYLDKTELLIAEIKKLDEFQLEQFLFGNVQAFGQLNTTLTNMLNNIEKVRRIPLKERHYDF